MLHHQLARRPSISRPRPLVLVDKGRVLNALSHTAMQRQPGDLKAPSSPKETLRSAGSRTHAGPPPGTAIKFRFRKSPESLERVIGSENKQRGFLPSAPRPNKTGGRGWAYAEIGSQEFVTAGSQLCECLKISAGGFWSSSASFWGWVNFMALIRRLHYSFLLFLPKMSDKFSR